MAGDGVLDTCDILSKDLGDLDLDLDSDLDLDLGLDLDLDLDLDDAVELDEALGDLKKDLFDLGVLGDIARMKNATVFNF